MKKTPTANQRITKEISKTKTKNRTLTTRITLTLICFQLCSFTAAEIWFIIG